jgi:cytochrome c-type biogenesis protein
MIDFAGWLDQVSVSSPLAFGLVALAGLLMGVAPSSLPLYSVVVGTMAARRDQGPAGYWQTFSFPSAFVLGIATVDAVAGALFAFVGMVVIQALAGSLAITNLVIALVLAVIGLALLRIIRVPGLGLDAEPRTATSFGGAFALGIPFGLSTCPACTPMVLPVLAAAGATGNPWLGAALLFTFGVARGLPLIAAGAATGAVKHMRRTAAMVPRIERAGGVLVLLAAGYFFYNSAVSAGLTPLVPLID